MTELLQHTLRNESETLLFGEQLAVQLLRIANGGLVIYLRGELGAGKTTLVRGILQGMGHEGRVKSPTYTLVEDYQIGGETICHFDLYRLADPEELEFVGIRDYFSKNAIFLVEWPERGEGFLPRQDIDINLAYLKNGRQIRCVAGSKKGKDSLEQLEKQLLKNQ